jgi:hypothetical protein
MAVINAYVSTDTQNVKQSGAELVSMVATVSILAADSDGSIYRLFKVNKNLVPVSIDINCSAITGGTSFDLGVYKMLELGGAVKDANALMSAKDLSAGKAIGSEQNGMSDLTVANIGKQIWELAGLTDENDADNNYDLAITANTVGSSDGQIYVRAIFAKTA